MRVDEFGLLDVCGHAVVPLRDEDAPSIDVHHLVGIRRTPAGDTLPFLCASFSKEGSTFGAKAGPTDAPMLKRDR